ncbi:hypothetical protein PIB30_083408 [Stylosanthes scabra]|uniref:Uncharacterized protein n=1 Tax=Stylosanthes scabra TaxID=79078 RepID=A0ABU6XQC1_9FABA|nr:hypothetical protein [Stylosanthes scabra]
MPDDADELTLRQYARCYIMLFIGGYLLPDTSSNLVHIRWVLLLRDFDECAALSWGRSETFPNKAFGWINVKDVAYAHIQAYEIASASGRYCLVERVTHFSELAIMLHHIYPTLKIPDNFEEELD